MREHKIGTILSYVGVFLGIAVGLLFTPFQLKCLGQSQYGIYVLMGSLTTYLYVVEAGFADTVLRYIARYRSKDDKVGIENFNAIVIMTDTVIAVMVVIVGIGMLKILPHMYGKTMTIEELSLANDILMLMIVNMVFTILGNLFTGYIMAYERFIFIRGLDIISQISSTGLMILVLFMGHKALAVVFVTTVCNLCVVLAKVFYCFLKLKIKVKFHKGYISKDLLREIFIYFLSIFVLVIIDQVYWKLDNIIIGMFASTSMIAIYSIGMSFNKYFMRFSTTISKIMATHVFLKTDMGATSDEITKILVKVSRIQCLVLCLPMIGLIIYGREFIYLWVGKGYDLAYFIALVTLIPYSFDLVGNLRNVIMQAKGIYVYKSYLAIGNSIIKVILSVILLKTIGILGAAIATGVCVLLMYGVITQILQRKVGIKNIEYLKGTYGGIALFAVLSALVCWGIKYLLPINSWLMLLANAAILFVVYSLVMFKFGINESEKKIFLGIISKVKKSA